MDAAFQRKIIEILKRIEPSIQILISDITKTINAPNPGSEKHSNFVRKNPIKVFRKRKSNQKIKKSTLNVI